MIVPVSVLFLFTQFKSFHTTQLVAYVLTELATLTRADMNVTLVLEATVATPRPQKHDVNVAALSVPDTTRLAWRHASTASSASM